ncbi:glycosyltransferase [Altererythrobacter salegens]|uniref:Glycosyltransferase n=1 Tax=Croceibacterium salegens TaxID=1737568 RepID=A0A6I4T036_9SPHN|nr:glycosyltransferase family 1 protein [Croceibacterium salegens]MXO60536.1 glycosyltransferase [Croceibacterium salegens]
MRIALVTDAWLPQVNGVVRTLMATVGELTRRGHTVAVIAPDQFRSVPCPTYPEIRLALAGARAVGLRLDQFAPDAVHLATEGPLGSAARRSCLHSGRPFTTAFHTQFPDYVARRTGLPAGLFWPLFRRFHRQSAGVMVATESVREQLRAHGIGNLRPWTRGVDISIFRPEIAPPGLFLGLPRPIQLYVGRVAPEKNIEAFLANEHPGSKVVVGDGPALDRLRSEWTEVHFLGRKIGLELAACYAGADVFVFPSRTDTFGLVMIEALACGTPVAAYPVCGPRDVLDARSGVMAERLEDAIAGALRLERSACLARARDFTWQASTDQFLAALEPLPPEEETAAPPEPGGESLPRAA